MDVCQHQSMGTPLAQNLLALPTIYQEIVLTSAIATYDDEL